MRASASARVDVLVNNAGTSRARSLEELTEADWQRAVGAERDGADAADERGRAADGRGGGGADRERRVVVGQAAVAAQRRLLGDEGRAAVALARLRRPLGRQRRARQRGGARARWRRRSGSATGGLADQTAEQQGITRDEALEQAAAKIPLGRMGTEEEIAAVVVFLCSARASNVTGAAWSADGGRRAADVLGLQAQD